MGILGLLSDQIYLNGVKENDFFKLQMAQYIFPFDREILIGPAQYYFKNKKLDDNTFKYLKIAIKHDHYSVQFLGAYIQLEYLYGNKNEAKLNKKKLEKIAPNSNALKRINEIMKGLN
jgi:hypothetical protein